MQGFIPTSLLRILMTGLLLAGSTGSAMAILGRIPATPPAPSSTSSTAATKLQAATSTAVSSAYTLHETQLENGTTVREYATATGPVFAISWSGPVLPDLGALLGDYFNAFMLETGRARMEGRRGSPFILDRDGLVIRSNGRMRDFFGYAYVSSLIPAGVDIKDVLP